jgi:predicted ATPase
VERLRRRPQRIRGEEMGQLAAALAELRQGQGGVVLLTGEAGVGKSRLMEELAGLATSAHAPPLLWLEGRCQEMSQAVAYAPFVSLLQAHLAAASPDASPGISLQTWLDELAAQQTITPEQRGEMGPLLARLLAVRDGEKWKQALAAAAGFAAV